jgi:SPP1 family predicted phage head-tail adaptor
MRIGKLRHRIELQTKSEPEGLDGYGEPTESWTTLKTVWASIEPASGKQLFVAQQVQAEVSHVVTIRYYDGFGPTNRVKFGTRIFSVNFVRNVDERNVYQELYCKEAV